MRMRNQMPSSSIARRTVSAVDSVDRMRPVPPHVGQALVDASITLGRSRSTAGGYVLRDALDSIALPTTGPWDVSEVVVFESQLGRGGARYQPLARLPLGVA